MGNSIYLGGGIKSAFCGGNVKEIWQGTNKLFPEEKGGLVIDGLTYRTAVMPDGREWTIENIQAEQGSAAFYNNDEATYGRNGRNYGRFYSVTDAIDLGKRVEGWHVPTETELNKFVSACGGTNVGIKLKTKEFWQNHKGTNELGFSVLPSGRCYSSGSFHSPGSFAGDGFGAYIVSSSFRNWGNNVYYMRFESGDDYVYVRDTDKTYYWYSVRLIKDE